MTDPSQINNTIKTKIGTNNAAAITGAVLQGVLLAITAWAVASFAPIDSPHFTGTVVFPTGTVVGNISPNSVTNAMLANSAVTVSGTTCTLGASCTPPSDLPGPGTITAAMLTAGVAAANLGYVITPTSAADFNTKIAAAIAAGYTQVYVTPGTYNWVSATTNAGGSPTAALINAPGNLIVDFQGSFINLTAADVGAYADIISVQNATANTTFTLRNVTVQYTSPPFAGATLTAKTACVANANGLATFTMLNGYNPSWANVRRMDEYTFSGLGKTYVWGTDADPVTGVMPFTFVSGSTYTVAMTGAGACANLGAMTVGNPYGLMSQQFKTDTIAFFSMANIVADNVKVLSGDGNGFVVWGAKDVSFISGSGCAPVLPFTAITRAAVGPCINIPGMSGKLITDPTVIAIGNGDDSFFAAPYTNFMSAVTDRNHITIFDGYIGATGIQVGDTLQFIDPTGALQGTARVTVKTPSGNTANLTLAGTGAPVGVATTWFIYNTKQMPTYCEINGGTFGWTEARGIALNCGNIKITSPHVSFTASAGVLVQYAPGSGSTGGVVGEIQVLNGVFDSADYSSGHPGAITVWGFGNTSAIAPTAQYGYVNVQGNSFEFSGASDIYINAASTIRMADNAHIAWNNNNIQPVNYQACGTTPWIYAETICNGFTDLLGGGSFTPNTPQVGIFGSAGFVLQSTPYIWTIANLPSCSSSTFGQSAYVSNGIAAPTFHQAVSATGSATWLVTCATDGTTYAWRY